MQLNEILDDEGTTVTRIEHIELPVYLSDFLQYPFMAPEPAPPGKDLTLTQVTMPEFPPKVAGIINRLKEATVTMEVLEVFHDLYRMVGRGQLIIDVEPGEDWPDFYEEWMGLNDSEPSE